MRRIAHNGIRRSFFVGGKQPVLVGVPEMVA
jgi:hypothetical protein